MAGRGPVRRADVVILFQCNPRSIIMFTHAAVVRTRQAVILGLHIVVRRSRGDERVSLNHEYRRAYNFRSDDNK